MPWVLVSLELFSHVDQFSRNLISYLLSLFFVFCVLFHQRLLFINLFQHVFAVNYSMPTWSIFSPRSGSVYFCPESVIRKSCQLEHQCRRFVNADVELSNGEQFFFFLNRSLNPQMQRIFTPRVSSSFHPPPKTHQSIISSTSIQKKKKN